MDLGASGSKYHGHDKPSAGYRYYSTFVILWWHQYDIYRLCYWPGFATFVLY